MIHRYFRVVRPFFLACFDLVNMGYCWSKTVKSPQKSIYAIIEVATTKASCSLIRHMHQNVYTRILRIILLNKLILIILFLYLI